MMDMQRELERLATIFYERSGKTEGRDLDNWLMAERFVSVWYGQKKRGQDGRSVDRRRVSMTGFKERRQNAAPSQL